MNQTGQIQKYYELAFQSLDAKRAAPPIAEVEFYNYAGLRHTIRIRDGWVFVRLSDLMTDAPAAVHQALAEILVAKLLRKRIPPRSREIYEDFARQPHVSEKSQTVKKERGHKNLTSAQGAVYDLAEIFARLNEKYFANSLTPPVLSWSTRRTFRIFGHHDELHETVVISRTLDDRQVPEFVAEFVLYHELLHIKHPTRTVNGRRQIHTAAFRRDERKFPKIAEAEKWLETLARQNHRRKS